MWCENLPWKGHGVHRETAPGWHTDQQAVWVSKHTQQWINAHTPFIHTALLLTILTIFSNSFVVLPCRHAVWSSAQSSPSKDAQPKAEGYKRRVSLTCHRLQWNAEVHKLARLMSSRSSFAQFKPDQRREKVGEQADILIMYEAEQNPIIKKMSCIILQKWQKIMKLLVLTSPVSVFDFQRLLT